MVPEVNPEAVFVHFWFGLYEYTWHLYIYYVGDAFKVLVFIYFVPVIQSFEFTGDECSITTIIIITKANMYIVMKTNMISFIYLA